MAQNLVRCGFYALVVDIPFTHLFEVFFLVRFILGPAHVKDVRVYLTFEKCLHEIFSVMIGFPAWELIILLGKNFGF